MKTCTKCSETKAASEFHRAAKGRDGLQAHCKTCAADNSRRWLQANRERHNANGRAWRLANPDRRKIHANRARLREFGLTEAEFNSLLAAQNGGCAICGSTEPNRRFSVDHDHACCPGQKSCGKCVRGLLCSKCNVGLGQFNDQPATLRHAAAYLESFA